MHRWLLVRLPTRSSRQLKFDHGKEDGVGDLLLVRQPLFADLCQKVVDTVSKFAI